MAVGVLHILKDIVNSPAVLNDIVFEMTSRSDSASLSAVEFGEYCGVLCVVTNICKDNVPKEMLTYW